MESSYGKHITLLKEQLGFYPHTWTNCADDCRQCAICKPFGRRVFYKCSGPPATPLAENSEEEMWFDGAIPDQPSEITRSMFPHQLKSVGDMERFERKEPVELTDYHPHPGSVYNLLGEDMSLFHVNPYPYRRCIERENGRVSDVKNRIFTRSFGIQADPVGYGKTLSVIALIARDRMHWDVASPHEIVSEYNHGLFKWSYSNTVPRVNVTLVLASLSCIDQWVNDFKFAPGLSVLVVRNTKTVKKFCSPVLKKDFKYDVVLTTPSMYRKISAENIGVVWKRFVFDEPAHVRVPGMHLPMAGFTWFVTATPKEIKSNQGGNWIGRAIEMMHGMIWHSHYSLMLFTVRNPTSFVQKSFGMPETVLKTYECRQRLVGGLRGIVSQDILTRIEAGDVRGAISELGAERRGIGSFVELIKDKKMRRKEEILFYLGRAETDSAKRKWEKSLKEIESQIAHLEVTAQEELKSACPICLEDLNEPILEPSCQQLFCAECLLRWVSLHNSCPKCRASISGKELIHLSDETKEEPVESKLPPQLPTKIECIQRIFESRWKQDPNAKFIVASQYSGGYWSIQKCLDAMGMKWCQISGRASVRKRLIESFNKGEVKVVFLGNLESTAGVNLQAATDVLMYNTMSESKRAQIIGRANRIGRKHQLVVHTLVLQQTD